MIILLTNMYYASCIGGLCAGHQGVQDQQDKVTEGSSLNIVIPRDKCDKHTIDKGLCNYGKKYLTLFMGVWKSFKEENNTTGIWVGLKTMSRSLSAKATREKMNIYLRGSSVGLKHNLHEVMGGKEGAVSKCVSSSAWYSFLNFRIFQKLWYVFCDSPSERHI